MAAIKIPFEKRNISKSKTFLASSRLNWWSAACSRLKRKRPGNRKLSIEGGGHLATGQYWKSNWRPTLGGAEPLGMFSRRFKNPLHSGQTRERNAASASFVWLAAGWLQAVCRLLNNLFYFSSKQTWATPGDYKLPTSRDSLATRCMPRVRKLHPQL